MSAAGAVLLALSGNYTPAVICALLCIFCSYCVPIYYKSSVSAKATLILFSAIEEGIYNVEELAERTGIEKNAALRLISSAINSKAVTGYTLDGESIIKIDTQEI